MLLLIKFLVFIETLFLDPIRFQKMTGRTISEFFMLLDKVGPLLARVSTKNPVEIAPRKRKFTVVQQFLMFLFWFRQYVIDEVLAWICVTQAK